MQSLSWFGRLSLAIGIFFMIMGVVLLIYEFNTIFASFRTFIMSYSFSFLAIGIGITTGSFLNKKSN